MILIFKEVYPMVEVAKKLLKALSRHFDALLPPALDAAPATIPHGRGYMARGNAAAKVTPHFLKKESLPLGHSYSHGFEKIYALESIDVGTVRPLEQRLKAAVVPLAPRQAEVSTQEYLPLGELWQPWIKPCFVYEPLTVLELSKQAEAALCAHGYSLLGELLTAGEDSFATIRGLGQGHIDEITDKLQVYVRGRSEQQSVEIEWGAWLRALMAPLPVKAARLLLETYRLEDVLPVSGQLQAELRRIKGPERAKLEGEAWQRLQERKFALAERLHVIVAAFILPWLRQRQGLASLDELHERLEYLSADLPLFAPSWRLLSDILGVEESPFELHLHRCAADLYSADAALAEDYQLVVQTAHTYFYHPDVAYPLEDIATWVARELTRRWQGCCFELTCKILRYAPDWRVRKASSGQLVVRKNPWSSFEFGKSF